MITTKSKTQIEIESFLWLGRVGTYGNDIDGTIAAIKKLVSAKDLFLTTGTISWDERTVVIDDFDVTGLSVMDLFHNQENKK